MTPPPILPPSRLIGQKVAGIAGRGAMARDVEIPPLLPLRLLGQKLSGTAGRGAMARDVETALTQDVLWKRSAGKRWM